jgi:hypothetical protein
MNGVTFSDTYFMWKNGDENCGGKCMGCKLYFFLMA